MRFILIGSILGITLSACAASGPEAPVGAQTVNADIEERIAESVKEGRSKGAPDLAAIPTTPPKVESLSQRAAARQKLLTEGEALKAETSAALAAANADDTALEKAEAIRAAVARDRAAVAAEKRLSEELAERP